MKRTQEIKEISVLEDCLLKELIELIKEDLKLLFLKDLKRDWNKGLIQLSEIKYDKDAFNLNPYEVQEEEITEIEFNYYGSDVEWLSLIDKKCQQYMDKTMISDGTTYDFRATIYSNNYYDFDSDDDEGKVGLNNLTRIILKL